MILEYTIIQKKEFLQDTPVIELKDITFTETEKIDLENLRFSRLSDMVAKIPDEKQQELNKTGRTVFTLVTTTIIDIQTENHN